VATAFIRPLEELRREDAGEFGGKSASLGELIAAGVRVPPGFALGAAAFRTFVQEGALPDGLAAELRSRYDALAQATGEELPPVAVRSSALGEDSEGASYAGQHESFLWVRGIEQVYDAVRDCWASIDAPRAVAYRGGAESPAMGVTVQRMVDAEVSGVLFTCNPVSGDPSMVAVNASWGLGLAVVGGEVTPDDYLVSKVTGEVVRSTVGTKPLEYVSGPDGAVRVEVEQPRRDEPCLGDAELAALVEVARFVERRFGSHQDVEWAIERGRSLPESLHVLQSRPVARLPERVPTPTGSALSLVLSTFGAPPGKRT
jgi:pyruvate, water dikinase